MKKSVYLTILAVVTVICVLYGTFSRIGGFAGSSNVKYDVNTEQTAAVPKTESGPVQVAKRTDGTVTEIHAIMKMGELIVKSGKEFSAEFNGNDKYKPEVALENGVLTVKQDYDDSSWFLNWFNTKAELVVTLPEGTVLDQANIVLHMGDGTISGLAMETGTIVNKMGRINISSCRFGSVQVEDDMGDVNINNVSFTDLSIQEDLGDITVNAAQDMSAATMYLKTDLGKVSLNGSDQSAEYNVNGKGEIRLTAHNDLGDINITY